MELWHLSCPHCLIVFYICTKFCRSSSKGFRVTDLNSRVDARVVANVDGRTDEQTNGRKSGSLYRAMPEAGATKISIVIKNEIESENTLMHKAERPSNYFFQLFHT